MFIGSDYPNQTLDNLLLGKGKYGVASVSISYNPNRPESADKRHQRGWNIYY